MPFKVCRVTPSLTAVNIAKRVNPGRLAIGASTNGDEFRLGVVEHRS